MGSCPSTPEPGANGTGCGAGEPETGAGAAPGDGSGAAWMPPLLMEPLFSAGVAALVL
jgi:hypothetical protein